MGNPFSYFLSSSDDDHAAVTIQRVWRGHRQRLFLKSGYYSIRVYSRTDNSGSPCLAALDFPSRLSSRAMTRAIRLPSPASDTAVIAAKAAIKNARKALALCTEWDQKAADIASQRSGAQDWSVRGFLFEEHHKSTLNINEALAGKEITSFGPEPLRSPSDVTTLTSKGQEQDKYQMKLCKDAKATGRAIDQSKYEGTTKVVASDQAKDIHRGDVTDRISGNDKSVQSDPITLEGMNEQTEKCRKGESITGSKRAEINMKGKVKDKNDAIAKFKKQAVRDGCKTAAKNALVTAAISGSTALLSSLIRLIPKFKGGEITISQVIKESCRDALLAAGTSGGMGLIMGILDVFCQDGAPKLAEYLGVGVAVTAWFGQVMVHFCGYCTGEVSTLLELAGKIAHTTLSMGAGAARGMAGSMAGAIFGPLGVVMGGFLGGLAFSWALDRTCEVCKWASGQRAVDRLLHALEFQPGGWGSWKHWWVHQATAFEILSVLEGTGPWGWWKQKVTRADVLRLVRDLGTHFRRIALKYHPDRAVFRGDSPKQLLENLEKYKKARDAHEQLVQLLNDHLTGENFHTADLLTPVFMLPDGQ